MFISKLQLQNFKRFTDLTIDLTQEPTPPKLILLIWANGCGKSNVFDVFQAGYDYVSKWQSPDQNYFVKWQQEDFFVSIQSDKWNIEFSKHKRPTTELTKKFYARPSIRTVPEIKRWNEGADDGAIRSIDFEERINNDVSRFVSIMFTQLGQIVSGKSDWAEYIRSEIISPFNQSLKRIFWLSDDICLQFSWFDPPSTYWPAKLKFKKWDSEIDFNFLSHGEKQIVIILLNFMMRKEELQDKIIFIDEMDVHLHTSLQYNLIKEISEYRLPENSQLWTATHALWFIDYVRQSSEWVIIDFDNLNFDIWQTLAPQNNEAIYEIAVPHSLLWSLFAGKDIWFCENKNSTLLNTLQIKEKVFVPAHDKTSVLLFAKENNLHWIIDRDYLTDSEKTEIEKVFPVKVLDYYCFENYLYHPDNLEEYYAKKWKKFDKEKYTQDLIKEKNNEKEEIKISKIKNSRDGYYFFRKQHENKIERHADIEIAKVLDSDNLESFLKVFTLKDFATWLLARQNINPKELTNTNRMKSKFISIVV